MPQQPANDPIFLVIAVVIAAQAVHDLGILPGMCEDVENLGVNGVFINLTKSVGRLDGGIIA
jgi:hypothetical protein